MKLKDILTEIEFTGGDFYYVFSLPRTFTLGGVSTIYPSDHVLPDIPQEELYGRVDYTELSKRQIYQALEDNLNNHRTFWDERGVVVRREVFTLKVGREVEFMGLGMVLEKGWKRPSDSVWFKGYVIFGPHHRLAKPRPEWTNQDREYYFEKIQPLLVNALARAEGTLT